MLMLYFFENKSQPIPLRTATSKSRLSEYDGAILCRYCRNPVTGAQYATKHEGQHEYSKLNPAGYRYHFACFEQAGGCRIVGEPTVEDTWFAGYTWQILVCNQCQEHLGWYFCGANDFYALIVEKLIFSTS